MSLVIFVFNMSPNIQLNTPSLVYIYMMSSVDCKLHYEIHVEGDISFWKGLFANRAIFDTCVCSGYVFNRKWINIIIKGSKVTPGTQLITGSHL